MRKKETLNTYLNTRNGILSIILLPLFLAALCSYTKKHISVQIGANCPLELSCSNFSKTVITKYGFFKGIALTADRLTRCTRLAGIDLIPGVDYNTRTNKILDPLNGYKFKD
ncbi:MAG: membrane protein insertion efficiency factor YidD [Sphingobacteriaceae bacterium]|nr:membrane protein insertion efficiency factor YidD [Sphingobacteriaceae bacterium]